MKDGMRVTKTYYHRGTSYAIGTIIDAYLEEPLVKLLYEKWNDDWGAKLEFPGRIYAITAEMILEVPRGELFRTYGPKRAQELLDTAEKVK